MDKDEKKKKRSPCCWRSWAVCPNWARRSGGPSLSLFTDAPAARWISHPAAPATRLASPLPPRVRAGYAARTLRGPRFRGQPVSLLRQRAAGLVRSTALRPHALALRDRGPAPHLRAGKNVLAALVWNWGPYRPVAQFSRRTAFLLQGDTDREAVANTGPEWKVLRNPGYEPIPVVGPAPVGITRRPRGSRSTAPVPLGLGAATFVTTPGHPPGSRGPGGERTQLRGTAFTGEARLWQLVPRSIPPMEEKAVRFATVRRAEGSRRATRSSRARAISWSPRAPAPPSCSTSRTSRMPMPR